MKHAPISSFLARKPPTSFHGMVQGDPRKSCNALTHMEAVASGSANTESEQSGEVWLLGFGPAQICVLPVWR